MPKTLIQQRPLITRPENIQGVSPFIAQILARRGVQSEQELELKLKHLLAPLIFYFRAPLFCWLLSQ